MELFPRRKEFLHSVVIWCKKELNQSAARMKVKITISIKSFINEKLNLQKTILFDSKKLLMPVMLKRSKMNSIQVSQSNVVSGLKSYASQKDKIAALDFIYFPMIIIILI